MFPQRKKASAAKIDVRSFSTAEVDISILNESSRSDYELITVHKD